MNRRNSEIDQYLSQGCGRCPLFKTPACKVHKWAKELKLLRRIVLESELLEERKWGVPCYTFDGKNVVIVSALKEYASISFFKGVLVTDHFHVLEKPGDNSQSARLIKLTSVGLIRELEPVIHDYIRQAIEIEKAGIKVDFKAKNELELPIELEGRLSNDEDLRNAWENLTPGRQRGYVLFISAAKQTKTREARIDKYTPLILQGKGMHD